MFNILLEASSSSLKKYKNKSDNELINMNLPEIRRKRNILIFNMPEE